MNCHYVYIILASFTGNQTIVPESVSGDQLEKAGPLQICQNSQRKATGSCQATLSLLQQEIETNRTLITLG